jgi:hypothetical protein
MNHERQACLSVIKCQSKEMKIPMLDMGRYIPNITSGPIPDWYWYKAGIALGHTRLVGSLLSVLISIPYTHVAPYILVQHWKIPL